MREPTRAVRARPARMSAHLLIPLIAGLALPIPAAAAGVTLVARQSVWKYHASSSAPAGSWTAVFHDDAAWPSGPGVLGFGETYVATTVPYGPNASDKYRTTYFRHAFAVTDPAALTFLTLGARYDDGFVAYLNGVEVARRGLPAGPISYSTLATSHEAANYEAIDLTAFVGTLATGTNVLAVEVHQTSPSSSDLVWDAELAGADGPQVTRGPYLQKVTTAGAVVRWRTNVATTSVVRHGPEPGSLTLSASTAGTTTEHEVAIAGLNPGTRVFYSIGTAADTLAGGDSLHCFTTAPVPGAPGPFRIWAFGDAGRATAGQAQVRDAYLAYMGERRADVWLMLGDNAYTTGLDSEYQAGLFDMYPTILPNTPLWPARGNHDVLHAGPDNDYLEFFTLPAAGEAGGVASGTESWYSFDHGNIRHCDPFLGQRRPPGCVVSART